MLMQALFMNGQPMTGALRFPFIYGLMPGGTGLEKNSMKLWSTHLLPRISSIFTPASHGLDKEDEYLTRNSADFHRHLGYELAGMFKNCGYKFDRWYSMIWMEKQLGPHSGHAEPIIPFQELLHRMPV